MNTPDEPFNPSNPLHTGRADEAAAAVVSTVQRAEAGVNATLDTASRKVDDLQERAHTAIDQAAAASNISEDAKLLVHDTADRLRETGAQTTRLLVSYAQEEPIKSVLVAAATGALLMLLLRAVAR